MTYRLLIQPAPRHETRTLLVTASDAREALRKWREQPDGGWGTASDGAYVLAVTVVSWTA